MTRSLGRAIQARLRAGRDAAGWRGCLLVTLTPWWGFFGLHALFAPPQIAEGTPIEVIPGWLRGGLWIGTAAYAVLAAVHPDRHPRALGWLMVMPCGRLASYAVQAVTHAVEEIVDRDVRWSGMDRESYPRPPAGVTRQPRRADRVVRGDRRRLPGRRVG